MPPSRKYSDPDVIAKIADLTLRSRRLVEGAISGQHRSPFHGFNIEFAEYREYNPGDDLRRLDWRVYRPHRSPLHQAIRRRKQRPRHLRRRRQRIDELSRHRRGL